MISTADILEHWILCGVVVVVASRKYRSFRQFAINAEHLILFDKLVNNLKMYQEKEE